MQSVKKNNRLISVNELQQNNNENNIKNSINI